jgi:hypothetical protein
MKQKTPNRIVSAAMIVLTVAIVSGGACAAALLSGQANASLILSDRRHGLLTIDAPIATSGDNIYIAWWTNKTGNYDVMFRASTNNGQTFGDKINLSNSTNADSVDAKIDASGDRVFVTWWERNATSNEPVLRISTDNGKTFGPILKLATNGTIGGGG